MKKVQLKYNLIIERTDGPLFYRFFSPELQDFEGGGISIDDCLNKATWKMEHHLNTASDLNIVLPPAPEETSIVIREENL